MRRAPALLLRAAPTLHFRAAPMLALHASPQREHPLIVAGVGLGLLALGARYALKILTPGSSSIAANVPDVPQPGSNDKHTESLSRVFYEGGFEDKMSKSEAARILGVRESANKERILQRYRTLMKINHPDRGGSPMLSLKVNEAKELLFKTAKDGDGKK